MNTATSDADTPHPPRAVPPLMGAPGPSERPALLCSNAGWGNRRAAEALAERSGLPPEHVRPIEDFIPQDWVRRDFERYRWICEHAPWSLRLIYGIPGYFALKRRRAKPSEIAGTAALLDRWLRDLNASHLVVLNHRAAFWASEAKAAGLLTCRLWAAFTDYTVSPGWGPVDWEQVEGSFGPVPPQKVPRRLRGKHREHPLAVSQAFSRPCPRGPAERSGRDRIVLTGGGWGLGDIVRTARELLTSGPDIQVRVHCGANTGLEGRLRTLSVLWKGRLEVAEGSDLAEGVLWSDAVVCRPGAMTLTEAFAAQKKIFLLPGLPVIEEANACFARRHFGAESFSVPCFVRWRRSAGK